jgi:hypothetical protein
MNFDNKWVWLYFGRFLHTHLVTLDPVLKTKLCCGTCKACSWDSNPGLLVPVLTVGDERTELLPLVRLG